MAWYINVVEPMEIKIDRSSTYILVGNKRLGVGSYNIKKGSNITLFAKANAIGDRTECRYLRLMWIDENSSNVVASNESRVCGGGQISVSRSIIADRKMKLKVVLQYRDEHGVWVTLDTYGC